MEEIEICAKCGKMVPMRAFGEPFTCPRCGNTTTLTVQLKDYEKVVQRLQEGKDPFKEEKPNPNRKKKAKKTPKKKKR
jgi:DNA-directed RNA polymerase subunit RPC12/RpoP